MFESIVMTRSQPKIYKRNQANSRVDPLGAVKEVRIEVSGDSDRVVQSVGAIDEEAGRSGDLLQPLRLLRRITYNSGEQISSKGNDCKLFANFLHRSR